MGSEMTAQVSLFVNHEAFHPEVVKRQSQAAAALCRWVRAMDLYHKAKQVGGSWEGGGENVGGSGGGG